MGMEDFQFMLRDLAVAFRKDATWQGQAVPGRFYINPLEVGLGDIEPGLGTTETKFYCDREAVPKPWPTLGDALVIDQQTYEVVTRDEDDLGEFEFRLIKQELGIKHVTSEGAYALPPAAAPAVAPQKIPPGRPTRRAEIVTAYEEAVAARVVNATQPINEILAIIRKRIGNGTGLSDRTLRKILADLRQHRL